MNNNSKEINIVFPNWVGGEMCACLGAIINLFISKQIKGRLRCSSKTVETFFKSNDFYKKIIDKKPNHTFFEKPSSIPYEEFKVTKKSGHEFNDYLDHRFLRDKMPDMSDNAWKKFTECLAEIFENARYHSESFGIYVCGQHYPNWNKLTFSIVDIGIGFKGRHKENRNIDLSSIEAINWSIIEGNTTKTIGDGPGGRGLSVLLDFIKMNKGKLQIVSREGFWEQNYGGIIEKELAYTFPGTVVSLEIDTSDSNIYITKEDL